MKCQVLDWILEPEKDSNGKTEDANKVSGSVNSTRSILASQI